mgnify:CR=1 FL=1
MIDSPKLRFKDFKLDIEYKELKEFISLIQSGLSRQLRDEDIGLPVLRSNNLQDNSIDIKDIKYWYLNDPQGANTSNYFLEKNDLLVNFINSISQIGKSAIYQNELNRNTILTTNIFRLRFNKLINPLYIGYFFQTKKYFDYIQSITKPAINQASFTTKEFQKLLVPYVSIEEQTKIANFLKAVDKKISQLNEQLQLMIQYKKGVMQKIFSQEIRFKDDNGEEFGEWEEKKLSDIANFRRGSFPQPYGLAKWLDPNGMPFVQVFDVSDNLKLKNFTKIKISKLAQEKSVFVKKGTLIITIQGTIGRVAKMQYDAYVDRTLLIFQSYKIDVNIDFIKYALFLLFELEKEKADGGIIKTITKETLSSFTLQLPSIKEQAQIANFLDVLDEKINNTFEQLQTVKQWKKGLLQQMLV